MSELRVLAESLAVAAGELAAAGRAVEVGPNGNALSVITKSSPTDVVTRHDRAAEALIVDELARRRPDDAIVGEEGTCRAGTSGIEWHIDPIDGTANFLYGLPTWSTSVGAVDGDGAVAGAVFIPATGELFSAARGAGATRNGLPVRANAESDLALALVGTGFGYTAERRRAQALRLTGLLPIVRDIRRLGSAAIDLVYTAAGFLDGYFEEHLNSWDMVAGELIAREAGCVSGDFRGGEATPSQLLVAAPGIFEALRAAIDGADSGSPSGPRPASG